jgi:hypothetical protein
MPVGRTGSLYTRVVGCLSRFCYTTLDSQHVVIVKVILLTEDMPLSSEEKPVLADDCHLKLYKYIIIELVFLMLIH